MGNFDGVTKQEVVSDIYVESLHTHFPKQVVGVIDAVHDPEHVAHVDLDRTGQRRIEYPVSTDAMPDAIEGNVNQSATGNDGWRGVAENVL